MKRNWLTSLSGQVAQRLSVHQAKEEELERARRESELIEQQRQREIEAAQAKVQQKTQQKEQKVREKAHKVSQKLSSHVVNTVQSGIIAQKGNAYDDILTVQNEITTFFEQIKAVHDNVEFEVSNTTPNYPKIATYIARKPHIILQGSESLSTADASFFKDNGLDVTDLRWVACEKASDVNKALTTLFDLGDFTDLRRDEAFTAEFRHPDITKSPFKIQASFNNRDVEVRCSLVARDYAFGTSFETRGRVMEDLLRWVVDLDIEKAKDLEKGFAKLGQELDVSAHHMRMHGHTQFMPKETDDVDTLKAKFEARMAASKPRLLKAAGAIYDMLPRPENGQYIDQVAKQIRGLNGVELSNGKCLSVMYEKQNGKFTNITIDAINHDHSFSSSPERFSARWVTAKDTFDIMTIAQGAVSTVEGPMEYRFDEQYHFLHSQIGKWLEQQDAQVAEQFFTAHPIYESPSKFMVAGYSAPKLNN